MYMFIGFTYRSHDQPHEYGIGMHVFLIYISHRLDKSGNVSCIDTYQTIGLRAKGTGS